MTLLSTKMYCLYPKLLQVSVTVLPLAEQPTSCHQGYCTKEKTFDYNERIDRIMQ
jgi:hypothetical protein